LAEGFYGSLCLRGSQDSNLESPVLETGALASWATAPEGRWIVTRLGLGRPLAVEDGEDEFVAPGALEDLGLAQVGLFARAEAAEEGGGCGVAGIGAGEDTVGAELGEGEVDEGAGRLGRVTLAAGVGVEDITDLDLAVLDAAHKDRGVAEEQAVPEAFDREGDDIVVVLQPRVGDLLLQHTGGNAGAPPKTRGMSTDSLRHPLTRTLLVLTLTTGVIDAACYLGLGRVFAANMTGNVVLLGFGIAGATGLPVVAPLVSLGAFLAGAIVGGRMGARLAPKETYLSRAMLSEVGLVALATLIAIVFNITPDHFSGDLIIALLAFAMGLRNATVRRLKIADLTTTVLTMTLTGLAADSPLAGGEGKGNWRRGAAVWSMLLGAVIGALLVKADLALVLVAAGALALLTWLVFMPAAITAAE
jgi:uncharacterized membrane protein YoaK (UPF0700 family)